MSNTILETLRSKHEEIEQLEKSLSKAITYKDNNPKERVSAENIMKKCINKIQSLSKELIELYEDKDGLYREETQILIGNKHYLESSFSLLHSHKNSDNKNKIKRKCDVWSNFYDKLKEIKDTNKRIANNNEINENISGDKMFNMMLDEVNNKPIFSSEENKGRCVDMHFLYQKWINIKGIVDYHNQNNNNGISHHYYGLDYLTYMNTFDNFESVSSTSKNTKEYKGYLISLLKYLKEFFIKVNPLLDHHEIQEIIDAQYKVKIANKKDIFCEVCQKSFAKDTLYQAHIKGNKHLKKLSSLQINYINNNNNVNDNLSYYEFQIKQYHDFLNDIIENTKNQIRKKQAMNLEELEADVVNESEIKKVDIDEEDTKPIYNPKNIPIGWDGKPIPYWLYKIHGLGVEYKCEICGGASYWGRKAFEHHFQEGRHTYGMKCLKLPNTLQFKEITSIEDALKLQKKLLEDEKKKEFRADIEEEFEDENGNIVNKKMLLDLQRKKLLDNYNNKFK